MDNTTPIHTHLRTQCGICGQVLLSGVSFVPLIGSENPPESVSWLDGAILPHSSNQNLVNQGRLFCWSPSCRRCAFSPEAVGIHSDCFHLFKQDCKIEDALDRLWVAIVSRSPWRGAPNFQLDCRTNLAVELVYKKAEAFGIPGLRLLPLELLGMIQDHSKSGTFWRYLSVLGLSEELLEASFNANPSSQSLSIPLRNISDWERGREPTLLQSSDYPPFIRLTIDHWGIRQVERLPSRPSYQTWRSNNTVFAIQQESQVRNVTAEFKYNLLRLTLPQDMRGFHVWDMPNPPYLEDCELCGHITQSTRFSTIDICGTTGLTFFYLHSKVYAVHAHTSMMPYAKKTFERLPKSHQADVAWVYFPIPKGEEVIALGVRLRLLEGRHTTQKPCFLIRTKLAGDVFLGPCQPMKHIDIILGQSCPRLFIYNTSLGPATVFGTYTWEKHNDTSCLPFRQPSSDNVAILHANFSSASLKGVTRIHVLEDEEIGFCRGILFDYENGAQRAVGNCRLGIDIIKTYLNPVRICYLPITFSRGESNPKLRSIQVESGCEAGHNHHEGAWVCSAMEGNLNFWFSGKEDIAINMTKTLDRAVGNPTGP